MEIVYDEEKERRLQVREWTPRCDFKEIIKQKTTLKLSEYE